VNTTETDVVEITRSAYERGARIYAGDVPEEDDPPWREACRSLFLKRLKGKCVLEIGCGPGLDAAAFHAAGMRVLATDICEEFLAIVRERFPDVQTHWMNLLEPDLEPASFDGIYGFASFLHVPHARVAEALMALHRLLRPGGVLFLGLIQSPLRKSYVVPQWIGLEENPAHFFCHAEQEMTVMASAVGFSRAETTNLEPSEDGPYGRGEAHLRGVENQLHSFQFIATK